MESGSLNDFKWLSQKYLLKLFFLSWFQLQHTICLTQWRREIICSWVMMCHTPQKFSMTSCCGSIRKSTLIIHWKDWCWSWSSSTFASWCQELTHWKRPWSWEKLKMGGEGDDRGCDVWMASSTWWTWIWASSGSWWWTGKPGVLQSTGSQRVRLDRVTELNWTGISLKSG